jgi:hypothetical protein
MYKVSYMALGNKLIMCHDILDIMLHPSKKEVGLTRSFDNE